MFVLVILFSAITYMSIVFVKTSKCGTEAVRQFILSNYKPLGLVLDAYYDEVEEYKGMKFKLSINHVELCKVEELMIKPIKYVGFIRNPLDRLISHYYYSNAFRKQMSFDEWYNSDNYLNGWSGRGDRTDNFISYYLGDIDKYELIIILEDFKNGCLKLLDLLNMKRSNIDLITITNKNNYNRHVSDQTKKLFEKRNKKDIELYLEVCKIYKKKNISV